MFGSVSDLQVRLPKFRKLSKKCPDGRRALADLVPLDRCNRALVGAGLRRLRTGSACNGLRALIDVAGRHASRLSASDIAFAIAPRINAAGRLEDMRIGIECLLSDAPAHARALAERLHTINAERQDVQQGMLEEAQAALDANATHDDQSRLIPCLFDAQWHPGVVGLIASKLKEALHRPVVAFAPASPDDAETLRGSARSIPGFHIRDALAAVDARHPDLIERFGGHAMAAGLSLRRDALPLFQSTLQTYAARLLTPDLLQAELWSDGVLEADELHGANACQLRDGGPWGQGYPEPIFDGDFDVVSQRLVADKHARYELRIGDRRISAIHFGGWDGREAPPRIRIAYRLTPDDWQGGDAAQLVIVHREAAASV